MGKGIPFESPKIGFAGARNGEVEGESCVGDTFVFESALSGDYT